MMLHSLNELCVELQARGLHARIVAALGVFDGVHKGHQAILSRLLNLAKETDSVPVALFFAPHPRELLFPPGPRHLTTLSYRSRLLEHYGAEYVVALEFTQFIADMSADDFLERHFCEGGLDVRGFCVGENWRFGKGNSAGVDFLAEWASQRGKRVEINVKDNVIDILHCDYSSLALRLSHELLPLKGVVMVKYQGKILYKGKPKPSAATFKQTLCQMQDPRMAAPVEIRVNVKE